MAGRKLNCGCYINSYGVQESWCAEHKKRAEAIWKKKSFIKRLPNYLGMGFVLFCFFGAIASILFLIGAIIYSICLHYLG